MKHNAVEGPQYKAVANKIHHPKGCAFGILVPPNGIFDKQIDF